MKTIDDVMTRAAEELRAQGAKNMPERAWAPPRQIHRPRFVVALVAAAVVLVLFGLPALFNAPWNLSPLSDPSTESEASSIQTSSDVPGLGRFLLTVHSGSHPDLGEGGCFTVSSPDLPGTTTACLQEPLEVMMGGLHIRAIEACNDTSTAGTSSEIGVIVLLGLPAEGASIDLTFDDGRVDAIESDSSAAIWAWDNSTAGLTDIAVSGFSAEQIRAAGTELPIGPCE